MRSMLISGLAAAGVMVAVMAPTTVKAEPQVLALSAMDAVTAGRRGWGGWRTFINGRQSNQASVVQDVSASASCVSNCSLTVSASALAVVEQGNNIDGD